MIWIILTLAIVAMLLSVGLKFKPTQGRQETGSKHPQDILLQQLHNGQNLEETLTQLSDDFSIFDLEALKEAAAERRQEIIGFLGHSNRQVRVSAAELVSLLAWQEVCEGLLPLLASKDAMEQLVAAEALARLGDGEIARCLLEGREHYLPDRIAKVLVGLGERVLPVVIEILPGADSELQCLLVEIAGEMKSQQQELVPYLLDFLQWGSPILKIKSAEALGRLGAEAAVPYLIKAMESGEGELRNTAVRALGMIRGPGAERALLQAREDAEPVVRASAQQALELLAAARDDRVGEN